MLEGTAQAAVMRPSEQVSGLCGAAWRGAGKLRQGMASLGLCPQAWQWARVLQTYALLLELLPLSRQMVH